MPKISDDKLKLYFISQGSYYPLYADSVKEYNALRVHADGDFPKEMIQMRRPAETDEILAYRENTYKPITKLPVSQVVSSFGKIRRSPDWSIDFPAKIPSGKISEAETLAKYCTENLPGYTSITNWAFGILLKQNLIDANAVIAVIPLETIVNSEFCKPVPILFNSDQVIEFNEREKFCILRSKRKVNFQIDGGNTKSGDIFYYIDDQEIITYEETKEGYTITFQQPNLIGQFPVYKVKSEAFKQYDNMSLNRSRLHAMVPFLDEAACEYSDLKASKIQHLYPLFWYFQNKDCGTCSGLGKVTVDGAQPKTCTVCGGGGKVKFSPFAAIEVSAPAIGQGSIPFSQPAGYITRDTEILKLQEASVDKNNFKALAAINMQFLNQTPLSISGDAKSVDREELNNTVYNSAEDLVHSVDRAIYFINEWRYSYIVVDEKARRSMLPNIPVPQNFDLLPEDYLMKEVTDARNAKINALLIATLEQQLAAKKFYNQPQLANNIKLYFDLDPLPGISVDEKMSLISNKAITQEDFIISSYMPSFIKRALREKPDFSTLDYDKQYELLKKYAKEKTDVIDEAAKMIDEEKQKVIEELKLSQPVNPKAAA